MSNPKVRENLRDRFKATTDLINFSVTKEVLADLRGRFGKEARSPQMPQKYHVPGTVGGLASTVKSVAYAVGDKAEKWWQEQAKITRRWVK